MNKPVTYEMDKLKRSNRILQPTWKQMMSLPKQKRVITGKIGHYLIFGKYPISETHTEQEF